MTDDRRAELLARFGRGLTRAEQFYPLDQQYVAINIKGWTTFQAPGDEALTLADLRAALTDETPQAGQATEAYLESRLKEGGLKLVSGSPTMLSDEFARFEAERLAAAPTAPQAAQPGVGQLSDRAIQAAEEAYDATVRQFDLRSKYFSTRAFKAAFAAAVATDATTAPTGNVGGLGDGALQEEITNAFNRAGWLAVAQIAEDRGDGATAQEARSNASRLAALSDPLKA